MYNVLVPTLKEDKLYINTIPKNSYYYNTIYHLVIPHSYHHIDDTSTVSVMYTYMCVLIIYIYNLIMYSKNLVLTVKYNLPLRSFGTVHHMTLFGGI